MGTLVVFTRVPDVVYENFVPVPVTCDIYCTYRQFVFYQQSVEKIDASLFVSRIVRYQSNNIGILL